MARADRLTIEKAKTEKYSDFTVNLDKNPLTGLLARLTNEESVKNSVRNIVKTIRRERFNQPLFGVKNSQLFDPADEVGVAELQTSILEAIRSDEPRVGNVQVQVSRSSTDRNTLNVVVVFSVVNIPQELSVSVILRRAR